MANEFQLKGLDVLSSRLKSIDKEVRRKGVRFGLRKAANLVAEKARQGARQIDDPKTANSIAENIAVTYLSRYHKATGNHKVKIGVRGGAKATDEESKNKGGDTFYWRFHEFGTQHIRARPFLRPALENNINASIKEFGIQTDKSITRALKKAKR